MHAAGFIIYSYVLFLFMFGEDILVGLVPTGKAPVPFRHHAVLCLALDHYKRGYNRV